MFVVQKIQAGMLRAITPRSKKGASTTSTDPPSSSLTTPLSKISGSANDSNYVSTPGTASTVDITANTSSTSTVSSPSTALTMDIDVSSEDHDSYKNTATSNSNNTKFNRSMDPVLKKGTLTTVGKEGTPETKTDSSIHADKADETANKMKPIYTTSELWQVLDREIRMNIGNSVKCSICLSTVTDPVRTKCMHKFCEDCITEHIRVNGNSATCPECNSPCTKRSLEPDSDFSNLADSYKGLLRAFSLAPGTYCPEITTMTQKVVDFSIKLNDYDSDDSNDNKFDEDSDRARFDRLCVAKTFQVEALPNCNKTNCSKLQIEENEQIVEANFQACCNGIDGDFDFDPKDMLPSHYKNNNVESLSKKHVYDLPNTQEVQEQAREQLEADREMEESMEKEVKQNEILNERFQSIEKDVKNTGLLLMKKKYDINNDANNNDTKKINQGYDMNDDDGDDDNEFFTLRRSSVFGSDSTDNVSFVSAKTHNDSGDGMDGGGNHIEEVDSEIFATATQEIDSQLTDLGYDDQVSHRQEFNEDKITVRIRRDRNRTIEKKRKDCVGILLSSSSSRQPHLSSILLKGINERKKPNGTVIRPRVIEKKVRMSIDLDKGRDKSRNPNVDAKDVFDGPSPSPSPPVPSPPLFARIGKVKSTRHTRKSFSKRDNHQKQQQTSSISVSGCSFEAPGSEQALATNTAMSSPSPFKTDSLSPINNESSFWVDEKSLLKTDDENDDDRRFTTMTLEERPRRCSSLGINVTGMIEDSRGGLHMMSMSDLPCASQQRNKDDNDDSENGTSITSNNDDGGHRDVSDNYGNGSDGNDGNDNADNVNYEDDSISNNNDESFNGEGETPSDNDDDDDKTLVMTGEDDNVAEEEEIQDEAKDSDEEDHDDEETNDKEESDNITETCGGLQRQYTNVTDEIHETTKNEIGKAANLPAGPKNSRQGKAGKKNLFVDKNDKNDDLTMSIEDKEPEATKQLTEASSNSLPSPNRSDRELSRNRSEKNKDQAAIKQSIETSEEWSKGTIVNVESRTWPGVNKPGGVGRIASINPDGTYNVAYVLGGRESNVEVRFMKIENQEDSGNAVSGTGAGLSRRRRRAKDEFEALPEELLRKLADEGFDTGLSLKSKKGNKKQKKNRVVALSDKTNAECSEVQDVKKVPKNKTATSANKKRKTPKRKKKDATSDVARDAFESEQSTNLSVKKRVKKSHIRGVKSEENDTQHHEISTPCETDVGGSVSHQHQVKPSGTRGGKNVMQSLEVRNLQSTQSTLDSLFVISKDDAIMRADELYKIRIQDAIARKSIIIAASNLSDECKTILKTICSKNFAGDLSIKITDVINKKTTLCIVPVEPDSEDGNIRSSVRTLKVMKSALAGIPIVSSEWLRFCQKEKKFIQPQVFVRSLPTKNAAIGKSGDADFGVAKLSSWNSQSKAGMLPFQNTFVFLCGNYSSDKRKNLNDLLKEGGAKTLPSGKCVSSKLKDITTSNKTTLFPNSSRIVIICDDSGGAMSKGVERDLNAALQRERHSPSLKSVAVVDSQWVIESVTCARSLPAALFKPSIYSHLWQLGLEVN